ncbi:substrate-binding domain-containing protein [Bacillota bacterium Meth-B3]|nr:substrate-binding domain-containing protein [Christensenellaceae bacterium]MEA5066132.1 substrate-binding domain-containing protein [Eubacteriales bacterium]MEA5069988.1 substrate-binding domain-containing protein [Christensenellaceae bacterium]
MKKLFALVLSLMLVFTATAALADAKVYLITMDLFDAHWVAVDQGCKDAAAELGGIEYKWSAPTQGKDDAAQIENINNAFADGADVILLASNGPQTQVATLEQIAAEGVKIIYVDSPADFDGALQTLATNNTNAGQIAGEQLLKALADKGVTEGKIGIVNINAATVSTQQRETGFRKAFEGSAFELLETQYGNGDATLSQEIANNYITEGCVGIFGANEGATVGVGNAIAENGNAVAGVGFDKSDAILKLVEGGSLLCTMAQNPYVMGYEGMKTAAKALAGETEFEDMDTGVSVIDAAYLAANK